MSEFEKIIGYDSTKEELKQICDMIHNADSYKKLGAKMSKGLLVHGDPGLGKTLMARAFIKESGRKFYIIRRNKHDGDFVNEIKSVFEEAAKNAPSIILLDDMDKFATEEKNEEEYVAVQACIDEVSSSDVYIIATTNSLRNIPKSLLRAGRFDRKIKVYRPAIEDTEKIIKHYMSSKSFISDVNMDDIVKMLGGRSCAELETILNEAAIYAGFERKDKISMEHIVRVILRDQYGVAEDYSTMDSSETEKTAYHEAGHIVMSEILDANAIGIASLKKGKYSRTGGFVIRCRGLGSSNHQVLMALAGKAAKELRFGKVDEGASEDLDKAIDTIKENIIEKGFYGMSVLDVSGYERKSEVSLANEENIARVELERWFYKAKEIIVANQEFTTAIANALLEKQTLLNSDIKKIRGQCKIIVPENMQ